MIESATSSPAPSLTATLPGTLTAFAEQGDRLLDAATIVITCNTKAAACPSDVSEATQFSVELSDRGGSELSEIVIICRRAT
jgi:hypothetical protein